MANKANKTTVVLNDSNSRRLSEFARIIKKRGLEINNAKTSRSSIINFILNEYFDMLLEPLKKPNIHYGKLKNKLLSASNDSKANGPTDRKLSQIDGTLQEIYYLLMSTNQTLARAQPDNYKNIKSMFKEGTKEYEIHGQLQQLTKDDAHRNMLLAISKNRGDSSAH